MGKYNFKVVEPRSAELEKAGFGRVARLPFILDSRPGIHRDGSEYLVERGLGTWNPSRPGEVGNRPSEKSIRNYASWLCNFLEWCETRGVNPMNANYVDHINGDYQTELVAGLWGSTGRPLSPKTVNRYVDVATDFVEWMAAKGKRPPVVVPLVTRSLRSQRASATGDPRLRTHQVRKGRVREAPSELRMPTDFEVDSWLESIYVEKGRTFGLMCETVLMTAVRRQEVASWRVDTLPVDPADWLIVNPTADIKHQMVAVSLRYGTKGRDYGHDHGDKIGPKRTIKIPLHLAEKLHTYRTRVRPRLLQKWVAQARGLKAQRERLDNSVHLFLNPEGVRQSVSGFYNAWKSGKLPYKEWSPHLGRHWWSCSTLMQEIGAGRKHQELTCEGQGTLTAILLTELIQLKIVPQLGHISSDTTRLYVQWVSDQLGEALPERYQAAMLDESEDES
jgi:hypothetical protein